ncbi:hypothetical protein SASPL_102652 [Salvia splendens]|uniref:Large ribosomal subunit protein uL5 C-terminal domain-containing protein n=1 Tax=Salvia splendens TaxID=180675 RepID=A0A8X9AE24_SALSN|nr:hypothetical protein SASPL_102652 [Salvia splendens]
MLFSVFICLLTVVDRHVRNVILTKTALKADLRLFFAFRVLFLISSYECTSPKSTKDCGNCGIGEAAQNAKRLDEAMNEATTWDCLHPERQCEVMYSFLDRLINLGLSRTHDFQGVSASSFDGNGNYNIGFREQTVFSELSFDLLGKPRGMDVCIETTTNTDKEAHRLVALMGMQFRECWWRRSSNHNAQEKKLKAHHF